MTTNKALVALAMGLALAACSRQVVDAEQSASENPSPDDVLPDDALST